MTVEDVVGFLLRYNKTHLEESQSLYENFRLYRRCDDVYVSRAVLLWWSVGVAG